MQSFLHGGGLDAMIQLLATLNRDPSKNADVSAEYELVKCIKSLVNNKVRYSFPPFLFISYFISLSTADGGLILYDICSNSMD